MLISAGKRSVEGQRKESTNRFTTKGGTARSDGHIDAEGFTNVAATRCVPEAFEDAVPIGGA